MIKKFLVHICMSVTCPQLFIEYSVVEHFCTINTGLFSAMVSYHSRVMLNIMSGSIGMVSAILNFFF